MDVSRENNQRQGMQYPEVSRVVVQMGRKDYVAHSGVSTRELPFRAGEEVNVKVVKYPWLPGSDGALGQMAITVQRADCPVPTDYIFLVREVRSVAIRTMCPPDKFP